MTETRERILDAAERLFGDEGYGATSLRHVIAEAGVNLAAVHYHFGSKEGLLDQLIIRRAEPINRERLALLAKAEQEAGEDPPPVEKILEAFLAPIVSRVAKKRQIVKLMGRMYSEGLMPMIIQNHFSEVVTKFLAALRRALPHLDQEKLALRFGFTAGAIAFTMFEGPQHHAIPKTEAEPDMVLREMLAFLSAGLRAPSLENTTELRKSE